MVMKCPAVYMVVSKPNGTIYTGVTSNLVKRTYELVKELLRGSRGVMAVKCWLGTSYMKRWNRLFAKKSGLRSIRGSGN